MVGRLLGDGSRHLSDVTGADWEGTGVLPDVPCAEDDALGVALARR